MGRPQQGCSPPEPLAARLSGRWHERAQRDVRVGPRHREELDLEALSGLLVVAVATDDLVDVLGVQ